MKPQPEVLTIWRIFLVIAVLIPAFLCSLFLHIGSFWWCVATGAWVFLFLSTYLIYLPIRYHRLSFRVQGDKLVLCGGVFYNYIHTLPFENIQFSTIISNPAGRMFGLCSLLIVAPGGRMIIPGLRLQDAKALSEMLPDGRPMRHE